MTDHTLTAGHQTPPSASLLAVPPERLVNSPRRLAEAYLRTRGAEDLCITYDLDGTGYLVHTASPHFSDHPHGAAMFCVTGGVHENDYVQRRPVTRYSTELFPPLGRPQSPSSIAACAELVLHNYGSWDLYGRLFGGIGSPRFYGAAAPLHTLPLEALRRDLCGLLVDEGLMAGEATGGAPVDPAIGWLIYRRFGLIAHEHHKETLRRMPQRAFEDPWELLVPEVAKKSKARRY